MKLLLCCCATPFSKCLQARCIRSAPSSLPLNADPVSLLRACISSICRFALCPNRTAQAQQAKKSC